MMDVISRGVHEGLPWELLFVDNLVLMSNSEERLREKMPKWKTSIERKRQR
jgi:hypothetical protein